MLLVHKKTMAHGSDSSINISVECENTVHISGDTYVYSDFEGCSCHVRFKGWITPTLNEKGEVTSFNNDDFLVEAEYDGWGEVELNSVILELLQEKYVFETV